MPNLITRLRTLIIIFFIALTITLTACNPQDIENPGTQSDGHFTQQVNVEEVQGYTIPPGVVWSGCVEGLNLGCTRDAGEAPGPLCTTVWSDGFFMFHGCTTSGSDDFSGCWFGSACSTNSGPVLTQIVWQHS